VRNPKHNMLPDLYHDEMARQQFVLSLKHHIGRNLQPRNKDIYEQLAKPEFINKHGHEPQDRKQVSEVMWQQHPYLMFSCLNRSAQEMMWDTVSEPIFREYNNLKKRSQELRTRAAYKGSIELNPHLDIPRGAKDISIHLQPGTYACDLGQDDILAGALYEGGGNLYSMGNGIGVGESKAEVLQRFLMKHYPNFRPRKILDIACSAGSNSTPWATAFPHAEVHAIDVGPSMLRYAHARAESLKVTVHFHQMDAGNLTFDSNSFDLVVSHNAMHEMPQRTTEKMYIETARILRPGGIALHQDVPLRYSERDAFGQFEGSWDLRNNNEPYWEVYATNDPQRMFEEAGFEVSSIWVGKYAQLDKSISWFVCCAQKPSV